MFPDIQLEFLFLYGGGWGTVGGPREMKLAVTEGESPS